MTTKKPTIALNIENQRATFWSVGKVFDTFRSLKISITGSKKNQDGSWDNNSAYFTCFLQNDDEKNISVLQSLEQKQIITISGKLKLKTEKREKQTETGKFNETIFTDGVIWINKIEIAETVKNVASSDGREYSSKNGDAPF